MTPDTPPLRRAPSMPLLVLLALLAAWSGWFILRTSFVSGGERVFCLFDDAMISMTYARNLVEGHGLNWARHGEPVEGFTHPLWTFLMVPVNALPLELRHRSLLVQAASLVFLLLNVVAVRRLMLAHFAAGWARGWLPAALLTAFYYPLGYWSLIGMETGLQALLTTASVHLALDATERGRDRHLALWLLGSAALLLRMDMLLMVATVQLYVLLRGGVTRRQVGHWLTGLAIAGGAVLGYGAFRWLYFHDLLPNTYYLKLTGMPLVARLLRGLSTLTAFVRAHLVVLLAAGLGIAALPRGDALRRRLALPAALFLGACAYSAWIGGDAWEEHLRANRFIAFVMPQVFIVLGALLNAAVERFRAAEDAMAPRFAVAAATAAAFLAANGLGSLPRFDDRWRDLAVTRRPLLVTSHHIVFEEWRAFGRIVAPDATVATVWAGIPAYFGDHKMVDVLGYNDRWIARSAVKNVPGEDDFERLVPGHDKWDYDHLIRHHRPDAFFQTWGLDKAEQKKVLRPRGYRRAAGYWVLAGSDKLLVAVRDDEDEAEDEPATPDQPRNERRRRTGAASSRLNR